MIDKVSSLVGQIKKCAQHLEELQKEADEGFTAGLEAEEAKIAKRIERIAYELEKIEDEYQLTGSLLDLEEEEPITSTQHEAAEHDTTAADMDESSEEEDLISSMSVEAKKDLIHALMKDKKCREYMSNLKMDEEEEDAKEAGRWMFLHFPEGEYHPDVKLHGESGYEYEDDPTPTMASKKAERKEKLHKVSCRCTLCGAKEAVKISRRNLIALRDDYHNDRGEIMGPECGSCDEGELLPEALLDA